ncbi:metalloregulator ArsR/SmtB family transcription factor [Paracoccus liaowanqingii]|uniref:Metalloregulator ArsR/SmtB family transcription factor n=1 Tax=Paracoccus liaowanqingii TaxID=2560053 RepID=A0A4P7HKY1_9RHOB|nr:metalloregulator ArsR/SmtB family transcription factor [Paracoccus liaowanqingii]QBX33751.1 metalloregulator ArsR/SmtB family transcription factor [Paracoccus liaowanqingii]
MEDKVALETLSALAQETRLSVFRLLVVAGPEGMRAGEIAQALGAHANTMSTNLSILAAAGLVRSQREGRAIRYVARMEGMAALVDFLLKDCCGGHPDLCDPLADRLTRTACPPSPTSKADPDDRRP